MEHDGVSVLIWLIDYLDMHYKQFAIKLMSLFVNGSRGAELLRFLISGTKGTRRSSLSRGVS